MIEKTVAYIFIAIVLIAIIIAFKNAIIADYKQFIRWLNNLNQ